ncbi:hypothetical protein FI667_g17361, partial [Globisporangium splendens]
MHDSTANNNTSTPQSRGVWTTEEHDRFLVALKDYPQGPWKAIAEYVGSRSARQVQTHAQKYYEKVARRVRGLRKDRKKVVRLEHRLDEDMTDLCKDVAGDEELAAQVESTRRGLSAMAIAMRRRIPPPSADQTTSSQEHKEEEIAPELTEPQAMRSSEDSDSSLSPLDEDYLSYLISILESRNFDHAFQAGELVWCGQPQGGAVRLQALKRGAVSEQNCIQLQRNRAERQRSTEREEEQRQKEQLDTAGNASSAYMTTRYKEFFRDKINIPGLGDIDDDVMSMPHPLPEFVKAPRLCEWSQQALVRFARERKQYEEKMKERCRVTGEAESNVTSGSKSSLEPRILDHLSHYVLKKDVFEVNDADLRGLIDKKIGRVMDDHVPDMVPLFAENLKMDLRQVDIEGRIAKYFMEFERLVEENGLTSMMGRCSTHIEAGRQRMKVRCKILIQNVQPEVLRVEITRLADLTHRNIETDDSALHDMIVDRATRQQRYHLIQCEVRGQGGKKQREAVIEGKDTSSKGKPRAIPKDKQREMPAAPRSGRWVCKGEHWLRDCPTATAVQKVEAKRKMTETRERRGDRLKRVTEAAPTPVFRTALVNGILEVPFCSDTGADTNIVGQAIVDELAGLSGELTITPVSPPLEFRVAGGAIMRCDEKISLSIRISTAAGPLQLHAIEFLILDGEDELLVGCNGALFTTVPKTRHTRLCDEEAIPTWRERRTT